MPADRRRQNFGMIEPRTVYRDSRGLMHPRWFIFMHAWRIIRHGVQKSTRNHSPCMYSGQSATEASRAARAKCHSVTSVAGVMCAIASSLRSLQCMQVTNAAA